MTNSRKNIFMRKAKAQVRKHQTVKLQSAKGRKLSSTLWLQRQLNDPYTQEAKRLGLRSRSAYKLIELDEKFGFLSAARVVIDLGCSPGGWLQVAEQLMEHKEKLIGIDLVEPASLAGVDIITGDFLADSGLRDLTECLGDSKADLVLSDMAANSSGHYKTDRLRNMVLAEAAGEFAFSVLCEGGNFVCKVFGSAQEGSLLTDLKHKFSRVRHFKPHSSRKGSPEIYVVAEGFRG